MRKDFFKKQENTLTALVPETGKNKLYYTKLLSLYPALNTTINNKKIADYLIYLKDDMQIKEDTPKDQKDILSSLVPKFKEQAKEPEKSLLATTNAMTQEIAVQRCVTSLQQYMDVNMSEKDNLLQQLKIKNSDNAVSTGEDSLMLHVD